MPKTKLHFILLIGMALPLACCKKDPPPDPPDPPCYEENGLPCATQTGENIYGCLVNGELWLPKGNIYYLGIDEPVYDQSSGRFAFRVYNTKNFDCITEIDQTIFGCYTTGSYDINSNDVVYYGCTSNMEGVFYSDSLLSNYIQVTTMEKEKSTISGIFEFTLVSSDKSDTIFVRQGRFDLGNVIIQ